jgi:hypothetical protein
MVAEGDSPMDTNLHHPHHHHHHHHSSMTGATSGGEFKIGMIVERIIEDTWFLGKITDYSQRLDEYTIQYLDDDLIEANVPSDEIRCSSKANSIEINHIYKEKKQTLSKPLLGLVEDDSEIRSVHQPVAILHSDSGLFTFSLSLSL